MLLACLLACFWWFSFYIVLSNLGQGIANTIPLPSGDSIHISHFCMRFRQHGPRPYVSNGFTIRVRPHLHHYYQLFLFHCKGCFLNILSSFVRRFEAVNLKCSSGRAKVIGTLVCIGGGALLTLYKGPSLFDHSHITNRTMETTISLSSAKKAERWTVGTIALVIGTLSWSSWFLLQSSIGKRYPCQYSSTAIMSFFGAIQSAILSFSTGSPLSVWVLRGWIQIATVLFAVSLQTLASFFFFF